MHKHPGIEVVLIDEYRTSKLCSRCKKPLGEMHNRTDDYLRKHKGRSLVWAVKHCFNSECALMTCQRDRNAAVNILNVFMHLVKHGKRPEDFRRAPYD
jgi:transposase